MGKAATGAVCTGLVGLLSTMVLSHPWKISTVAAAGDNAIEVIGQHFFSDYLLPFELASVLLLIALVGAIILARREYIPDVAIPQEDELTLTEKHRELVAAVSPENTPKFFPRYLSSFLQYLCNLNTF